MLQTVRKARLKLKVCTVGEEAVGKTSLVRRFVADKFDGDYIRTIGTLISKKTLELEDPMGEPVEVDAVIWDIMGRQGFMDLLKDAYFYKANGVLAVCDMTRRETMEALHGWLKGVYNAAGPLSTIVLSNKSDLKGQLQIKEEDMVEMSEFYSAPYFMTSAKTGDNVYSAFESLIRSILQQRRQEVQQGASDADALRARIEKP